MMDGEKDPVLEALRAQLPPGVSEFVDYAKESLWPVTERCARKMGLTPTESRECAVRVVRAATQQMAAAFKRAHMRDAMPPTRKS